VHRKYFSNFRLHYFGPLGMGTHKEKVKNDFILDYDALKREITGMGGTIMIVEHLVRQYISIFSGPPQSGTLPLGRAFLKTLRHCSQVGQILSYTGNQSLNPILLVFQH